MDSYPHPVKMSVADAKNKLSGTDRSSQSRGAGDNLPPRRTGGRSASNAGRVSEQLKFGVLKDRIVVNNPDWWKPMTDKEADAFPDGRY